MQFRNLEDGIEVSGDLLGAVLDGFERYPSVAVRYLTRFGLVKSEPDKPPLFDRTIWYPFDRCLDAYAAIATEVGFNSLYSIGNKIPENVVFPSHINDIYTALSSIDVAYHMNHRKRGVVMFDPQTGIMLEGIGHYSYRLEEKQKAVIVCENPNPCEFDRGIITALATRFAPASRTVHDNDAPCRKKGGASCTYIVWW